MNRWFDNSNQGVLGLQQIHNPVGKTLFANHDVELTGSRDLLQDFQLPETHKRWVVGQHLHGVGLAATSRVMVWCSTSDLTWSDLPSSEPSTEHTM